MLNRRSFLSSLAGVAAALTLDPEKLLWVPGKKLISIPAPQPVIFTRIGSHLFAMGDVVEFSGLPGRYIVTSADGDFERISDGLFTLISPSMSAPYSRFSAAAAALPDPSSAA